MEDAEDGVNQTAGRSVEGALLRQALDNPAEAPLEEPGSWLERHRGQGLLPPLAGALGMDPADALFRSEVALPLWWALALGACLGGNGTMFGAAANVVVVQIARRNGYRISWGRFTAYGLPVMLLTLVLCSIYLLICYG